MAHEYITCQNCGKTEDLGFYHNLRHPLVETMVSDGLCYDCAYWRNWFDKENKPETLVVSGILYIAPNPIIQPMGHQARNGKLQFLYDPADNAGYATTGLLPYGRVPSQFKDVLPDRYKLITRAEYRSLRDFEGEMCLSKGCFDRYHCLWYRADIAEPKEPWNKIPENYTVGSESCPSFINKEHLL